MRKKILISGFGGQGVMMIGNILAQAAFESGLETTVMPTYGVEQRGGTANTTITIADYPIGSPTAPHPDILIAMNQASIDRFGAAVKPSGTVIINESQEERRFEREDVTVIRVDADIIAEDLGSLKSANVVVLGAVFGHLKEYIPFDIAEGAMNAKLGKKVQFAQINREAFKKGYDIGAE